MNVCYLEYAWCNKHCRDTLWIYKDRAFMLGHNMLLAQVLVMMMIMMMMMMVLCPKAGSLDVTQPGDEMSEVVSHCLPHRQWWVSNLSKVATQWLEVDSNRHSFGCKAENFATVSHLVMGHKHLVLEHVTQQPSAGYGPALAKITSIVWMMTLYKLYTE